GFRGAEFVAADVFDAASVARVVSGARPDVIIHQLTDLAGFGDPAAYADAIKRNARIRAEGTRNLVSAARAANVPRIVAQSIAWVYAPGPIPHAEEDSLDLEASELRLTTIRGVAALEDAVLRTPGIVGTVLLHVDAAAFAALLAVQHRAEGIFNVAERGGDVTTDKAESVLHWSADM